MDLFEARQPDKGNMATRHFPPPWSVVRHPQEQEEPSRNLDGSAVCFLIELKPAPLYFTK
jgi:hypothetical protein